MQKVNSPKIRKCLSNVHKRGGAHVQCMNNYYVIFDYLGMKTVGVTDYTNQTLSKQVEQKKNVLVQTPPPQKNGKKYSYNVHKIDGRVHIFIV